MILVGRTFRSGGRPGPGEPTKNFTGVQESRSSGGKPKRFMRSGLPLMKVRPTEDHEQPFAFVIFLTLRDLCAGAVGPFQPLDALLNARQALIRLFPP